MIVALCLTPVRSHVDYQVQLLVTYYQKGVYMLVPVQRRVTKIITR